ncbi:MAG: flavodoxin domain-containing protein [Cellulosilyticaceae bacterium]
MKTLIVYSSSYGFTERCAKRLAANLEDADVVRVRKIMMPNIKRYDQVIIGSPIYMRQIDTWIKVFCENKLQELLKKEVGIFICCGEVSQADEIIGVSFPKQLLVVAKSVEVLGGEVHFERLRPHHKVVIKAARWIGVTDARASEGPGLLYQNHQRLLRMLNG